MDEFGNDFMVLTDENGNEVELELLDSLESDGKLYLAFADAHAALEEPCELIVLRQETDEESGEEILVSLDDDDEYDEIFSIFVERLEALEDEEEDDDIEQ